MPPQAPTVATTPADSHEAPWRRSVAAPGGYAWWYFDALDTSGDGLVCILFAGSVFSPRYAERIRRGERALPTEHAAVNLALYRGHRPFCWVMSEHGANGRFDEGNIAVGGTRLEREGAGLRIELTERSAPFLRSGSVVEGIIRVEPLAGPSVEQVLSSPSAPAPHAWRVIAPRARIRANFCRPAFTLDAPGYHDHNHGGGRLEESFTRWGWARFHGADRTSVVYSLTERNGARRALALQAADDGGGAAPSVLSPLDEADWMRLGWGLRVPRRFGGEGPGGLACEPTAVFEKTPFYSRFRGRLVGEGARGDETGLGEWLDLDRFRAPFIQYLLGYKMRFESP